MDRNLLRLSSNQHQVPTRRRRTDSLHSRRILGDPGAVSRRARRKNSSIFSSVGGRGLPLVLENFRRAFSPGPTGSPRMDSTRLKERLRGTLRSDWPATRFKRRADIAYKCSCEPIRVSHRGGKGTPYNGLHGEAPPEKGSFFSLRCKREGVY